MHASTPDGRRFMVVDGYGLTRVELPNKLKNDRKAMCSDQGAFSLDARGPLAALLAREPSLRERAVESVRAHALLALLLGLQG